MSLPTIEMPKPVPEPEVFPAVSSTAKTDEIIESLETKPQERDLVVEDYSDEESIADSPEPDKEEDVFKSAAEGTSCPSIKPVVDADESIDTEVPEDPPKKTRKKYERKAPMSQKQKDHLAKIRKIAADKRKIAREEKAKAKEDADIKKAEEKIKKQQAKFEQDAKDKIKAEHEENLKIASDARYTQMDLEEAMVQAVATYDTMRKERKVEKKKKQAEDAQKTAQKNMIHRAIQPNYIPPSSQTQFSHCFQ